MGAETYHWLRDVIKEKYGPDACNVGDEGGFAPDISSAEEGLDLLKTAIQKAGYTGKIFIGMDVAASEFFKQVVQLVFYHVYRTSIHSHNSVYNDKWSN